MGKVDSGENLCKKPEVDRKQNSSELSDQSIRVIDFTPTIRIAMDF